MTTFDNSSWDGSPSNWDTPEAYCKDCVIDLNEGSEKTKEKCKLPYRKPGSSAVNKNALRAMATGARGLAAVDAPAPAKKKAAEWIIKMWPAAFGQPAPDSIYRLADKTHPAQKMVLYKDRSGVTWFMGIYSNNFIDRESEILSWDSHLEYATWVKTTGVKPPIVFLHQPHYPDIFHLIHVAAVQKGLITAEEFTNNLKTLYRSTAVAQAETVIPLNGFMIVVGKVFEDKLPLVEKLSDQWGMSHSFARIESSGNIITKYRTYEFTLAPRDWVANNFTPIAFKENVMDFKTLSDEDRALVEQVLNESAEDLESGTEKAREILSQLLESKMTEQVAEEEPVVEEEVVEEEASEYEQVRDKLFNDMDLGGLVAAFKSIGVTVAELAERMAVAEEKMGEIKKTEDQRIAEFIAPDWTMGFAKYKTTEDEDEQELLESLKEQADRKIVEDRAMPSNPLNQGFWGMLSRGDGI